MGGDLLPDPQPGGLIDVSKAVFVKTLVVHGAASYGEGLTAPSEGDERFPLGVDPPCSLGPNEKRVDLQQPAGLLVVESGLDVRHHEALALQLADEVAKKRLALVELDETKL